MRREVLLVAEMIDAAEGATAIVAGLDADALATAQLDLPPYTDQLRGVLSGLESEEG